VESSCEHAKEPSGSIKFWEVLAWLHNWWFLKKGSAPWVNEWVSEGRGHWEWVYGTSDVCHDLYAKDITKPYKAISNYIHILRPWKETPWNIHISLELLHLLSSALPLIPLQLPCQSEYTNAEVITFARDNFRSRDATGAQGDYNSKHRSESVQHHRLYHLAMIEQSVHNELKTMWKEAVMAYQDRWFLGWDLKPRAPKYEARALCNWIRHLMQKVKKNLQT
jgi:hypothetical protein